MSEENDGRMSFKQAVGHVMQSKQAAFSAMPVFGDRTEDEGQTAEGARIFILDLDDSGSLRLRFIAGPFFSTAHAANEAVSADEIPDSVRDLRFMPTRCEEDWFSDQIQLLIQKLVKASTIGAELMPDYQSMPSRKAEEQVVFPISFIGRDGVTH
ncbi:MAG: hypothetical protein Q8L93_00370 [Rhodocyclaceae bacterium]|nr:hypothetical protein [Rhodocyclaceae bacterium]MDP1957798.1 hypothetical protein [Rhodocyclaceae bacterium]